MSLVSVAWVFSNSWISERSSFFEHVAHDPAIPSCSSPHVLIDAPKDGIQFTEVNRDRHFLTSNMAVRRKSVRNEKNASMLETRLSITVGEVAILQGKVWFSANKSKVMLLISSLT